MREKRRFIRFDASVKVLYAVQKDPKIEKQGTTKNISPSGIQLLTPEALQQGDKLELKVFIPNALNPAHLTGTVKWVKEETPEKGMPYSAGIEFTKIEEDNKNTFLKFLCGLMYKKSGWKE